MKNTEALKAEARAKVGSRHARKLRASGRIPASLPSDEANPHVDFHIDGHVFMATRRRHSHVYDIQLDGKSQHALVRELQWDTFGDAIIHIDFKRVRLDVKTDADVELEFVGHPKGGLLNHLVTHVKIRAIPTQIPDSIEVPVSHLMPGGVIYARELVIPEGVELVTAPETKIANAVIQKVIEETPAPAAADSASTVAAPAADAKPGAKPDAKAGAKPDAKADAKPGKPAKE
jgi:large subunit ribosomal protein L25